MNRAERRKSGLTGQPPILDISPEHLAKHMPHVKDGDLAHILANGEVRLMRVRVRNSGEEPRPATGKP